MKTRSRRRSVLYSAATVLIALVVLEVGASWLMLVYYRATHQQNFETYDTSYLSVVNLARRFSRLVGLSEPAIVLEETQPSPFLRPDPLLGYSAAPGVYTHSYARRNGFTDQWEYFRNKVTINPDGSRFTGAPRPGKPTVYIFGDSWVFGNGVPDELTFAGRLHEALPDWNVRLLALGGYSLTQAWLTFERLKEIGPDDIVILGYADYFDVRHVEAPSRLLEIESWLKRVNQPIPPFRLPKATLAPGGRVTIDTIDQRCAHARRLLPPSRSVAAGDDRRHGSSGQPDRCSLAGQGLPAALRRLARQPGARQAQPEGRGHRRPAQRIRLRRPGRHHRLRRPSRPVLALRHQPQAFSQHRLEPLTAGGLLRPCKGKIYVLYFL